MLYAASTIMLILAILDEEPIFGITSALFGIAGAIAY